MPNVYHVNTVLMVISCLRYSKLVQVLSQTVKANKLSRSKFLLEDLKDDRQPPVLLTDKKLSTVKAIHNRKNDRIYAVNKENIQLNGRIANKRQKPVSVMVWAGVASTGEENSPHLH